MKKIYLVSLAFMLLGTACDDVLEKTPGTSLPVDEAITSVDDLQNAVNGVYAYQATEVGSYGADFTLFADLRGGDFQSISTVNHAGPMYRYQLDKNHSLVFSFYKVFYVSLARINSVLAASENLEGDITNLQGELYAMRALYHFDLARLFAKLPTTGDMNGLGVVLSDNVFETSYIGERATLQATYDFIISDLNKALPMLTKDKAQGHINYWAALGIRARAYLYLGKYAEALNDCKEIIASSPYKLYSIDEYLSVWDKEGTNEAMFEILTTSIYNAQRNSIGYYTHAKGYGECAFTESFKAEFDARPNDIRTQLIAEESDNGYTGFYPQKYKGRDGQIYVNNPKVIRLSEVYLIAAECALKEGNAGEAARYINTLRQNRIAGYVDVTSVTLDDILMERRLELFTEGHTSWDYWRNGKSVNNKFAGEIKADDYRTILPMPMTEINVSGGKLQQNPNY
ncbi:MULTISPECIES: RagB/SusD family nutrient uptake outer membrane protein [Parabacteroides]|uniref:RagB/SusD family nutrient uptake outer membrane protein n=1 Tax=Parabacteroides leei TaxID=2939491 RepID=UPI001897C25C|nr:RagB/SusD family nutrient uptake outer membrane protein [Parabacteroides goldsteinii]